MSGGFIIAAALWFVLGIIMDKKPQRTPNQKQESFEQINASWAIEGQVMDARDLYNQRRIISGDASHEEILEQLREEYGVERTGSDPA